MAFSGQTLTKAFVVAGQKFYAADFLVLITELQALNDELVGGSGAVALTGDETIAGIKTFSSFPITPSSAPTTDYQAANKKYVDVHKTFSEYTTEDDDSETLAKDHDYLATSDGFVYVSKTGVGDGGHIYGYLHTSAGAYVNGFIAASANAGASTNLAICYAVAEGEYFEINANTAPDVYWRSIGTLSKPTDQEAP